MNENGAMVEGCSRGKPEIPGERSVPVPLCPPQIPPKRSDRLTSNRLSYGTATMIISMMIIITIIINNFSKADKSNIMQLNILIS